MGVAADQTIKLESISKLVVMLGDFIQVTNADQANSLVGFAEPVAGTIDDYKRPYDTHGEFMRVVEIDYATSKVTVIRNVVPNCMPDNNWIATDERKESGVNGAGGASEQGLAFAVNDVVSLVRPDYSTVQMRDAVTKMAGLDLRGGATLADVLVDSGSCGVDTLINVANYNKRVYKTAMDATAGGGNNYVVNRFRVGMYIRIGADAAREYMLVTDTAQTATHAAGAGTDVLTVIRNVRP